MPCSFDHLLHAARQQTEPQRLLFVFAVAELPDDASAAERERFAQGGGGSLRPVLCVDKLPEELESFAVLLAESQLTGQAWDLVFAAALPGVGGLTPGSEDAQAPLEAMVASIESGSVGRFAAFDRAGQTVDFY